VRTVVVVAFALAWAVVAYAVLWRLLGVSTRRSALAALLAGAVAAAAFVARTRVVATSDASAPLPRVDAARRTVACDVARPRDAVPARGSLDEVSTDELGATALADGARVRPDDALDVRGWAADPAALLPADGVCVAVDGRFTAQRSVYGTARPDVAGVFAADQLGRSGFEDVLRAGTLRPGAHRMQAFALVHGAYHPIGTARRIVVSR